MHKTNPLVAHPSAITGRGRGNDSEIVIQKRAEDRQFARILSVDQALS